MKTSLLSPAEGLAAADAPEGEALAWLSSDAVPAAGSAVPRSSRDLEILRSLARRISPQDAGAHNNLGVVFYQKGLI